MKKSVFGSHACAAALLACATPAHADEETGWSFEAGVASSYIGGDFNQQFSDDPVIQLTGTYNFTPILYANAYVYSGFDSVFESQSSEYGFEVGADSFPLFANITGSLSAGRFANYGGQGSNVGDWFVKGGLSVGDFHISHSRYLNVTDGSATNIGYDFNLSEKLVVTPSVAYLNLYDDTFNAWNPGLAASYALGDAWHVNAVAVWSENEDGGRDEAFSVSVVWNH